MIEIQNKMKVEFYSVCLLSDLDLISLDDRILTRFSRGSVPNP